MQQGPAPSCFPTATCLPRTFHAPSSPSHSGSLDSRWFTKYSHQRPVRMFPYYLNFDDAKRIHGNSERLTIEAYRASSCLLYNVLSTFGNYSSTNYLYREILGAVLPMSRRQLYFSLLVCPTKRQLLLLQMDSLIFILGLTPILSAPSHRHCSVTAVT